MQDKIYWLGFSLFQGIGPKKFDILLNSFGSAEAAWHADIKLLEKSGIGPKTSQAFVAFRESISLDKYVEKMSEKKIDFICLSDSNYPPLLKEISNPPFVLFYTGDAKALITDKSIAIVGTRNITNYGATVTTQLTEQLSLAGFTIVSGLAFGVDAIAHRTTLKNSGKTVAVLGCGIDCCSPREHVNLYAEIVASGGAVVSEYPLGVTPVRGSFPARNRVIAGLSQAVLVTEGAADSGALYTAKAAFSLQRPVFAVPGPITSSLSKGPFALLSKGAKMVTSAEDILMELGSIGAKRAKGDRRAKGDTEEEQKVIDVLENEELLFDEISRKTKIPPVGLGVLLTMMEMKKMIKNTDGKFSLHF